MTSDDFDIQWSGTRSFTHVELDSLGNLNQLSITEMDLSHEYALSRFKDWKAESLYDKLVQEGKTHFYYIVVRLKCGDNPKYDQIGKIIQVTPEQLEDRHIRLQKIK